MNKLAKYLNNDTELEKESKYQIKQKPKEKKEDITVFRQNIRIYILFGVLLFLIFIVLKEITYDYVIIRKAGINYSTLCENMPDNC